jgi:hypothetical protein
MTGGVFPLRCLELMSSELIVNGNPPIEHVAQTRARRKLPVAPRPDRKFKVQQTPVTMPEVIEVVSDSEEERM